MLPAHPRKTLCEFFAGIGLVNEALRRSGWQCTYANDIDSDKAAMYRAQFQDGEHYHEEDVWATEAVLSRIGGAPFLATASFPCTDMSLAGRMQGFAGAESSSFFGFAKVLERLAERRPPLVLLENVVGFLASRHGADFTAAVDTLAALGYWCDALVLDARDFLPQSRPRLFVLGFHDSLNAALLVRQPRDAPLLADHWRQTLDGAPRLRPARLRRLMDSHRPATGWATLALRSPAPQSYALAEYFDQGREVWWNEDLVQKHYAMLSDAHRREIDRLVSAGGCFVATAFRRIRQGVQRLEVRFDGVAGCLRTPRGGSARQIVVAGEHGELRMRWMTPREYARLQGAGDYVIEGSATRALFGFGDAVCVPVIRWLDEHILTPIFESAVANQP